MLLQLCPTLRDSVDCSLPGSSVHGIFQARVLEWGAIAFSRCWSSNTLATSCEELTHWKRPWCWERLKAAGEVGKREWDGWMVSSTQWKWVWTNSGSEGTGSLACCSSWSRRVRHDLETEQRQQNINRMNSELVYSFTDFQLADLGQAGLSLPRFLIDKWW